jgi:hypothetical protein
VQRMRGGFRCHFLGATLRTDHTRQCVHASKTNKRMERNGS